MACNILATTYKYYIRAQYNNLAVWKGVPKNVKISYAKRCATPLLGARARLWLVQGRQKNGSKVARIFQARPGRCGKHQQEQNSRNLGAVSLPDPVRGLVKLFPAVAYHFCLNLPGAFSEPRTSQKWAASTVARSAQVYFHVLVKFRPAPPQLLKPSNSTARILSKPDIHLHAF